MKPYQTVGMGGAPPTPMALDPNGLVPVNRSQPVANDGMEPQRLMERRMGTMPPSSFSGAGQGFVPVERPMSRWAVGKTDMANAEMATDTPTGQQAPLSAEAMRAVKRQQMYSRENVRQAMMMRRNGGGLLGNRMSGR